MDVGKKAVVLLSGGLDSATVLAIAKAEKFELYALTFRYGQRHGVELNASRRIAERVSVKQHVIFDIDLRQFGGSSLTTDNPVAKDRSPEEMSGGIPLTYVPGRNIVFLSIATAWAETLQARDIFIGVNAVDYSGYPDCRPEFIAAFERMANLGTKASVEGNLTKIHAPLVTLSKQEIIRRGLELGVDYGLTSTCYDPVLEAGAACGKCDACQIRLSGFQAVGMADPAPYSNYIAG
ncbi:MAG TPA: 7-cyano-7-deazaguanine synthase QueC [Schlesneria sp.]|jgi:7-cyano-7-deazaguanine synthase